MENYNNEQEHDWCLICLVRALDETGDTQFLGNMG